MPWSGASSKSPVSGVWPWSDLTQKSKPLVPPSSLRLIEMKAPLVLGVYAYEPETLLALANAPPCALEEAERLEQLRALWLGVPIEVFAAEHDSIGVDTPADADEVRRRLAEGE